VSDNNLIYTSFTDPIKVAGLPTQKAFGMGVGFLAVGFLGTILSWFLLVYFGRRTIYNAGLSLLAGLQILIGILDCAPNYSHRPNVIWAQSSLMVVWNFFYDLVSLKPNIYHLNIALTW
jgi:SP family general alpha glucoside:H+ symporter-like MFS transporter